MEACPFFFNRINCHSINVQFRYRTKFGFFEGEYEFKVYPFDGDYVLNGSFCRVPKKFKNCRLKFHNEGHYKDMFNSQQYLCASKALLMLAIEEKKFPTIIRFVNDKLVLI